MRAYEGGLVVVRMSVLWDREEDLEEALWVEVEYLYQYQSPFSLFCILSSASFCEICLNVVLYNFTWLRGIVQHFSFSASLWW